MVDAAESGRPVIVVCVPDGCIGEVLPLHARQYLLASQANDGQLHRPVHEIVYAYFALVGGPVGYGVDNGIVLQCKAAELKAAVGAGRNGGKTAVHPDAGKRLAVNRVQHASPDDGAGILHHGIEFDHVFTGKTAGIECVCDGRISVQGEGHEARVGGHVFKLEAAVPVRKRDIAQLALQVGTAEANVHILEQGAEAVCDDSGDGGGPDAAVVPYTFWGIILAGGQRDERRCK